jgi:hypothetical protein
MSSCSGTQHRLQKLPAIGPTMGDVHWQSEDKNNMMDSPEYTIKVPSSNSTKSSRCRFLELPAGMCICLRALGGPASDVILQNSGIASTTMQ